MAMLAIKLQSLENNNVLSVKPDKDSLIQVSEFMDKMEYEYAEGQNRHVLMKEI